MNSYELLLINILLALLIYVLLFLNTYAFICIKYDKHYYLIQIYTYMYIYKLLIFTLVVEFEIYVTEFNTAVGIYKVYSHLVKYFHTSEKSRSYLPPVFGDCSARNSLHLVMNKGFSSS